MESNWKFFHIAVVVRDMEKAVEYYKSLGTVKADYFEDSSTYLGYEMFGKTPDRVDKTRMVLVLVGSVIIELVQPLEGEPIYKEFLESIGEGVHHIAYFVDDIDEETAKLAEKGIPRMLRAIKGPGSDGYAYFDSRKVGNVVTELVQVGPSIVKRVQAMIEGKDS